MFLDVDGWEQQEMLLALDRWREQQLNNGAFKEGELKKIDNLIQRIDVLHDQRNNYSRVRDILTGSRNTRLINGLDTLLDNRTLAIAQFTEAGGFLDACVFFGVITEEQHETLTQEFGELLKKDLGV